MERARGGERCPAVWVCIVYLKTFSTHSCPPLRYFCSLKLTVAHRIIQGKDWVFSLYAIVLRSPTPSHVSSCNGQRRSQLFCVDYRRPDAIKVRLQSDAFQLRKHCAEVRSVFCVWLLTQTDVIFSFLPRSVILSWVTASILWGDLKSVAHCDTSFWEDVCGALQEALCNAESERGCAIGSDHNTEKGDAEWQNQEAYCLQVFTPINTVIFTSCIVLEYNMIYKSLPICSEF
jgi:hypothetical protein